MNLQNQNAAMKTVVETFIVEETESLIYDNEQLDKWNKHVTELGLEGQTKIVKPEKSPIPFMHMKQTTKRVFETLCPQKVLVEKYNISPIPVEILDLVALSKKEQYFDKIEIWYDDKNLDPACVGFIYNNENDRQNKYSWTGQWYLLGKWADVKASLEELTTRAVVRWKAERKNMLTKQIKDAQRELEDLEINAFRDFGMSDNNELPF